MWLSGIVPGFHPSTTKKKPKITTKIYYFIIRRIKISYLTYRLICWNSWVSSHYLWTTILVSSGLSITICALNEWMYEWMALCNHVSYLACCHAAISFSETVPCFGESGVQIAQSFYIPMYCLSVLLWILAAEAQTPVMFHLIKYCQIYS